MKGASTAPLPGSKSDPRGSALIALSDLEVSFAVPSGRRQTGYHSWGSATRVREASSFTSLIPLQNEPNVSQAVPSVSMKALGAMAFQLSRPATAFTPQPWSTHLSSLDDGSSVLLVATPIADVFLPNEEHE